MTRINVVPVEELQNVHLLAEYRELPRIFALAKNYYSSGKKDNFPQEYTLGKGHVKFFYNKLLWLKNRQVVLVQELLKRGFAIQHTNPESLLDNCPQAYVNDYLVTDEALKINRQRINLRWFEYLDKIEKKKKK